MTNSHQDLLANHNKLIFPYCQEKKRKISTESPFIQIFPFNHFGIPNVRIFRTYDFIDIYGTMKRHRVRQIFRPNKNSLSQNIEQTF